MKTKLFCIAILFYASFASAVNAFTATRNSGDKLTLVEENEID